MTNLLIFFALPIATIIISIALQKIFKCPFLVAAIIFAIFLVVTFILGNLIYLVATIAYTTQYVQDASLPVGQQKIVQAGSNGRKVEAYKVMKLNGKIVSTTLLSRDTYNAMQRVVHVGTKQ